MILPRADWKLAIIAAAILTALAVVVVFVFHPGGFETQDAWFLALLPLGLFVYPVSDFFDKVAPRAEPTIFWVLLVSLNFLWYWTLSYVAIRIRRGVSGE